MEKSRNKTIDNIKKSLHLIHIHNKFFVFLSIVITIFQNLLPVASLLIMQRIINIIQTDFSSFTFTLSLITIYVLLDILYLIVQTFWQQYNLRFNLQFKLQIDLMIQNKLKNLSLRDYESSEIYDKLKLAQNQSGEQLTNYINLLTNVIGSIVSIISYVMIILFFQWWIALIIIFIPLIKYFLTNKFNFIQYNIIKNRTSDSRKAWYWNYIVSAGHNFKELKTFKLFDFFANRYKNKITTFNKQDISISFKRNLSIGILSLFEIIINGLLFVYIIYCGFIGLILIGNILTYTKSISSTKTGIQEFLNGVSELKNSTLYIDLLFEFLELPTKDDAKGIILTDKIKTIEFKNLSFKYNNQNSYVLKNINLIVNKEDFIVVLGENGCGKTTLIKLLMGFYDDYEGEILINGIELRKINHTSYLDKIGSVFQDYLKYEASVKENIGYGNIEVIENEDLINKTINKFFTTPLPLNMLVGHWFDDGQQISMGQWQKLALSRAFIKKADLYILDEPNAALDPISEKEISLLFQELFQNKMGIVIAHKFSNLVSQANKIIVIENGCIIEEGNHETLIFNNGKYKQLFDCQVAKIK